ncbi:hypothetical protein BTO10_05845 [Vibrio chagasii]|uniref:Uncharacterized protein n=1 Tax=Vibrio chagasii TaxID=170679 RepID=A0A2S7VQI4_9VIBR|nr:hypothetical protein [Vibrio chagasii]PQJ64308.1 hypothetical protein BTO10_05845 [Vibrio chagasii]
MSILAVFSFLTFVVAIVALILSFILGIILGHILKVHEPSARNQLFAFYIPISLLLLYGYVKDSENANKIPRDKLWLLVTLKYLIPTAIISGSMMFITGYFAFTNQL